MSDPLTPPDCDCRGLPFMPLEVSRLVDSDFAALSTGDEFKAGLILWAKSWTQVPAGSIPDDDRILARLVGCSLSDWLQVKAMALHNWIRCSDSRLYHPVIADLALKAAQKRRGQSERANSRWAKAKLEKNAKAMPRHENSDATAQKIDAVAMQGRGTVEGIEPPLAPPGGIETVRDEGEEAAARRKPKRPIPADFPDAEAIAEQQTKARAAGKNIDLSNQAQRFRNWALGKDARYVDWGATWRNWADRAVREAPTAAFVPTTTPRAGEIASPWPSRVQAFIRNAYWNTLDWGPRPGQDGCMAPKAALDAVGFTPNVVPIAAAKGGLA